MSSLLHYSSGVGLHYISVKNPTNSEVLAARHFWKELTTHELFESYKRAKTKGSELNFRQWLVESANESFCNYYYDL
jgi:hypothetical protein